MYKPVRFILEGVDFIENCFSFLVDFWQRRSSVEPSKMVGELHGLPFVIISLLGTQSGNCLGVAKMHS